MRGSDILQAAGHKENNWSTKRDTHIRRISWESIDHEENHGCELKMRWRLKPSKTDEAGTMGFEKTFLLDPKPCASSAAHAIRHMPAPKAAIDISMDKALLFMDVKTGKKISITHSSRELTKRVEQAVLYKVIIKGYSLMIGGATSYANSTAAGTDTVEFIGFWASGALSDYMLVYKGTLEKAVVAVGMKEGRKLARSRGPVAATHKATHLMFKNRLRTDK